MQTKPLKVLLCLLLSVWIQPSFAIPSEERAALIRLYNTTNGGAWSSHHHWLEKEGTECQWEGVTCRINNDHITSLSLSSHNLNGVIPDELGALSELNVLALDHNQLTGAIPLKLGVLPFLGRLDLSYNQLTGSIPSELGQLSQLWNLDLSYNQLTGSIPSILGQLSQLSYLDLEHNQLTGFIPSELKQLSQLGYFDLTHNQLTGAIPLGLGQLSQLKYLDLSENQLSGVILAELGQLHELEGLNLDDNNFSGAIPSELGLLPNISWLGLRNNQLTGTVPPSLFNISQVHTDRNCLTGVENQRHCDVLMPVAIYNANEQRLAIDDVRVGDQHYSAILQNRGDFQFSLISTVRLAGGTHSMPAVYDLSALQIIIPSVSAFGSLYTATLQYNPEQALFSLVSATP
jgi:Leucine-rich repeat (LRR) protein